MKLIRIILLTLLLTTLTIAQESDFPQLDITSFDDIKIEISKYYNGDALWGLINGGADLYLEYGFDKLLHQQVKINGTDFRVEIYRMVDSFSAFGIFSISKFKCDSSGINNLTCITKYQTQGVIGNYYLSITNSSGNNEDQKICQQIYKILSDQITSPSIITVNDLFPSVEIAMDINNIKFIKGQLGIQNGYPIWTDILERIDNFTVSIYSFEKDGEEIVIGEIHFQSKDNAASLISKKEILTKNQNIKKIDSKTFLITDSNIPVSEIYTLLNLK